MRVGFVGLGNVGGKLAGSLARNGVDVTVCDLDPARIEGLVAHGAKAGTNPAALMAASETVITCLPSPSASRASVEEMLPHITPGKRWLEMSTTDAAEVQALGAQVEAKGGAAVDCPVSGGCHRAATGNISIFAGCERPVFEAILPLLTTMGRRVLHTGPLGSASILKVITNYLATANLLSCVEALTVAKGAGIDLGLAYDAIAMSSGTSFVHETESQVILNGSRDISFTLGLVAKDIGLFQEVADRAGVPIELNPLMMQIIADGISRYGADANSPGIIQRLEEATGLDVRAPGFPPEMQDDEPEEPGYEVRPRR